MIMVFPFVEQNNYGIFMAVFFWCLAEMARFLHYSYKNIGQGGANDLSQICSGFLRYNLFWFCYPLGIAGEIVAVHSAYTVIMAMAPEQRPYFGGLGIEVGGYDLWNIIFAVSALIWIIQGPTMFLHMMKMRARYNKIQAEESA
jgi:hypothetical protein